MTSHDTHTQHSSHHQLRIGCVPRAGMGHALAGIPAPPPLWNYVITGVMGSKGWGSWTTLSAGHRGLQTAHSAGSRGPRTAKSAVPDNGNPYKNT